MSEMIERVARAIDPVAFISAVEFVQSAEAVQKRREYALAAARAAIAAMREPTAAMLAAAEKTEPSRGSDNPISAEKIEVWQAMIDTALEKDSTT